MRIYLVRHGQTESTGKGLYVGMSDVPLNEQGYKEAKLLGQAFKGQKIDVVYCSTLMRSIDTAKEIAQVTKASLKQELLMNEIDFGLLDGHDFDYINKHFPEVVQRWATDVFDLQFPEGENFNDLLSRVRKFKNLLLKYADQANIVVVGHAGFLKLLTCDLLQIDDEHWWKFKYTTASISEFMVSDGVACIYSFNNLSYNLAKE
ncbi:MAG: histidine phosphatase family protein [Chloroflexi bacterium]|nr:histidine phosphatase family protein [Chloroflexota bacterium]